VGGPIGAETQIQFLFPGKDVAAGVDQAELNPERLYSRPFCERSKQPIFENLKRQLIRT
jgi:hypothetical protein